MLAITQRLDEIQRAGNYHARLTPSAIRLEPDGVEIDSAPPPEPGKTLVVSDSKYLAPECLFARPVEAKATAQSDVYSLGFISYEWLLGQDIFAKQFPFEDLSQSSFEWMQWHRDRAASVAASAELCSWIPATLSKLVQRMLSKDAAQRPASYEALIKELEDIRHRIDDTDHLIHVPSIEKIGGFGKSHGDKFSLSSLTRWPGILLVFLVVALVGALVGLLLRQ